VSAVPNPGYRFVNWTLSGTSFAGGLATSTDNPISFEMPANPVTLTANFAPTINYPVIKHFTTFTGKGDSSGSIDAPYGKFVKLLLLPGGSVVDPNNYTAASGSTVITLKESYLKTLANGTYTYRAEFTDGYADLVLTVNVKTVNAKTANAKAVDAGKPDIPQTSDSSNMIGWIIALLSSALGMLCIFIWRKRRQTETNP
jgi:hypothetical protein